VEDGAANVTLGAFTVTPYKRCAIGGHFDERVMAHALYLTEDGVRNYLSEAIEKLGAWNRGASARIAERQVWL